MPPSGFNRVETKMLSIFAESLLSRFEEEVADGRFTSLKAGIEHELEIIEKSLASDIPRFERGTLEFVRQLYLRLREVNDIDSVIADSEQLSLKKYE